MATIQEIIALETRPAAEIISDLKEKSVSVPSWTGRGGLIHEYDPKKHPVMSKTKYPDVVNEDGSIDFVTRIPMALQKLAVKRMSELCNGVPVKRIYKPAEGNEQQKQIAKWLETIYEKNRINSVNTERCNLLFAGCEVMTLWYAVEKPNDDYGFDSPLKFRCKNYSPMLGDELYPLFDEYGDMIALSVGYNRKKKKKTISYFDTYTDNKHLKWSNESGEWLLIEDDTTTIGKIPGVYTYRLSPIWEDSSPMVFESEWAISRNGNYLRKNSKPLFAVFADEEINYGSEESEDKEFKTVLQYRKGSDAKYVTWEGAIDNLKFYIGELRQSFFTQLQLPDFSFESMKSTPMSGEARKQLFIDAQLKVKDESGPLLEFYDREMNVVKAFLKTATDTKYHKDIDALKVETEITPFTITDDKDTIETLTTATGGKAVMSQREAVTTLGWSSDVDQTMKEIAEENKLDSFELTE
ncbi:MAG: phage portal protein [Bacteroidales bacterium]